MDRRAAGSGEGDARCRPPPEGSLQPVWRLVPGDGRLQLRRRHGTTCRGAHRLCRFLGALQARRAAAGDAELRAHHPGRDHHRQEPRAVWSGAGSPEPARRSTRSPSTIPWTCAWWPNAWIRSVDYLQELNPSLLRMTTPKDQSFMLNLPAGSREKYRDRDCRHPAGHAHLLALSPGGIRRYAAVDRAQVSHLGHRRLPRPTISPATI